MVSPVKTLLYKLGNLQQKLADNNLPHMLVYATGSFSIIIGVIFLFDAENFVNNATFASTFEYALPQVWGSVLALTAALMMFGFWQNRTAGRAPAFVLTLLFTILGLSAAREPLANPEGPALLSASAVYTFVGIICAICIFACSSTPTSGGDRHAQARTDDHVHH